MRLGAMRISVNRRRGVANYIEHMGGDRDCKASDGFSCAMLKPYPKRPEDRPSFAMIEKWNVQNPTTPETDHD